MAFNPFKIKVKPVEEQFESWCEIYPRPYDKCEVDPYTKTRIILMNGTEFEAQWFSRNFSRHCTDNDLRREIALTRRMEQQQQKKIACLKPKDETILEHTISYEQLAVDLTASVASVEPDCYVKAALDFALLEDFDHLYRYSNLMRLETGECAERLIGGYTEITPGRPTISEHRFPADNIRKYMSSSAALLTKLHAMTLTAAEQQTMNYYMNVVNLYPSDLGRRMYQEIAMIEEEHVSQYESLLDPTMSWLENLLLHEYNECYLYYSCYMSECDLYVKRIWEECLNQEIAHLQRANELLQKYEGKDYTSVVGEGTFPQLTVLHPNIEYVRKVLTDTVQLTSVKEDYVNVAELSTDAPFFYVQNRVNGNVDGVPTHNVICAQINSENCDYRFECAPNPIPQLQNRRCDNTDVGRAALDIPTIGFTCNETVPESGNGGGTNPSDNGNGQNI